MSLRDQQYKSEWIVRMFPPTLQQTDNEAVGDLVNAYKSTPAPQVNAELGLPEPSLPSQEPEAQPGFEGFEPDAFGGGDASKTPPPVVVPPPNLNSMAVVGTTVASLSFKGTQGPIKTAVTQAPSDK